MSFHRFYGLNRTLCEVLQEMRKVIEFAEVSDREQKLFNSLIEEAQVMGNRMEAGLEEIHDLESLRQSIKEKKKELKELEEKVSD